MAMKEPERDDDERPSVRRIPASGVHVAIKLEQGSDHVLWSDLTLDVSRGGVFVATFLSLSVGTVVHLLLTFEGDDIPVAATGIVRWTRPHRDGSDGVAGAGIQFSEIDAPSIAKAERFAREVRGPMIFEPDEAPVRKKA